MPALSAFYCLCALWTVITLYMSLTSTFLRIIFLWLLVFIRIEIGRKRQRGKMGNAWQCNLQVDTEVKMFLVELRRINTLLI